MLWVLVYCGYVVGVGWFDYCVFVYGEVQLLVGFDDVVVEVVVVCQLDVVFDYEQVVVEVFEVQCFIGSELLQGLV